MTGLRPEDRLALLQKRALRTDENANRGWGLIRKNLLELLSEDRLEPTQRAEAEALLETANQFKPLTKGPTQ